MSQMIDRLYKMSNYCVREIENPDVAIFYKREIEEFKGLFLSLKRYTCIMRYSNFFNPATNLFATFS